LLFLLLGEKVRMRAGVKPNMKKLHGPPTRIYSLSSLNVERVRVRSSLSAPTEQNHTFSIFVFFCGHV
jgi:hypothetical protein